MLESLTDRQLVTPNRIIGAAVVLGVGVLAGRAILDKLLPEPQPTQNAFRDEMDRRRALFVAAIHGGEAEMAEFRTDLYARYHSPDSI